MKRYILAAALVLAALTAAACDTGGDNIDGYTTEKVVLYTTGPETTDPHTPTAAENAVYEKVKGYFSDYYGDTVFETFFDPSERETYAGDECYIFLSFSGDIEGFKILYAVSGGNVYGFEPSTGVYALIWCEGWAEPDFSYFGEKDISGL